MAFRILTLDGGGSRGVYTLGVLNEVESELGSPLHQPIASVMANSMGLLAIKPPSNARIVP